MTKQILAVIPARRGSKGLPRKNVLLLEGKPLIQWTIEASLGSKHISKTVVSSDDPEILSLAGQKDVCFLQRPEVLSTDTASSEDVLVHAIQAMQKLGENYDYAMLLQPTSPLRNAHDIDLACEALYGSAATALISVCPVDNKLLKAFIPSRNGYIQGVCNNNYPFMRRQDLPPTYMSNGAIYIIRVQEFLEAKFFFTDKTIPFIMSTENSKDIDTRKDFEEISLILKNNLKCF